MDRRARAGFLALILAQAAHSVEEYLLRLYDVFEPARVVSELASADRTTGFAIVNAGIVLFAVVCWATWVRSGHPAGRVVAGLWAALELANGIGHVLLAISRGGYFPGAATAPLLIAASSYLGLRLLRSGPGESGRDGA